MKQHERPLPEKAECAWCLRDGTPGDDLTQDGFQWVHRGCLEEALADLDYPTAAVASDTVPFSEVTGGDA